MIDRGALVRALAIAFLLSSLAPQRATAERRHRVVLLDTKRTEEHQAELLTRLRAELSAAGFDVALLTAAGGVEPKALVESMGSALNPAAVVLVHLRADASHDDRVAELWVSDRIGNRTLMQSLMLDPRERSRDMSLFAVQTVELLKARLASLSVPDADGTRRAEPRFTSSTGDLDAVASRTAVDPTLSAGIGILSDFAGVGSSWAPVLRCGLLISTLPGWSRGLELRFTGAVAATRVVLQSGDGAARIRQGFGTVDAVLHAAPNAVVHPFFLVSSGVFAADVTGEAPEPHRAHEEQTWSGLSGAGIGLWARWGTSLAWVLEAQGLAAWSPTRVTIEGTRVGDFGAPMLFVSTGLVGVL